VPLSAYVGSPPTTLSAWPDLSNTGVPPGTTLTPSGPISSSSNGQIIDALNITGTVTLNHANVTLKRCRIRQADVNGVIKPLAVGCRIQDCELDGSGGEYTTGIWVINGVLIERVGVHHCENGFDVGDTGGTIRDCYLHDMTVEHAEPSPHVDGLQGSSNMGNLTVEHCQFYMPNVATSAINIYNEVGGTANHITINNNLFRSDHTGMGYIAYFPRFAGWSNIVFTDNICQQTNKGYFDSPQNVTTWFGNVDYDTGLPLTNT